MLKVEKLIDKIFKSESRVGLDREFVFQKLADAGYSRSKIRDDMQMLVDKEKFLFFNSDLKKLNN